MPYVKISATDFGKVKIIGASKSEYKSDMANSDVDTAIDILDPGCSVCAQSFMLQTEDEFFTKHKVTIVPFPIQDEEGNFKFKNSELIVRYILSMEQQGLPLDEQDEKALSPAFKTMRRVLIETGEYVTEVKTYNYSYQQLFNEMYSAEEAEAKLQDWLKEFGYHGAERSEIIERAHSDQIGEVIKKNNEIVTKDIHAKGIPTMIYDGRKHTGKYEE